MIRTSPKPSVSTFIPPPSKKLEAPKDGVAKTIAIYLSLFLIAYICFLIYNAKFYFGYLDSLGVPPHLSVIWIVPIGYLYSLAIYLGSLMYFKNWIGSNLVDRIYKADETHEMRVHRLCNDLNGLIYYTTSVLLGVYCCWGSEYLPWAMGGKFEFMKIIREFPLENPNHLQYFYFLMGMGHHLERLIEFLLKQQNNGQYWIVFFHHVLTCAIMATSYLCGTIYIGLPVLLLHDLIEPTFNLSKLAREVVPLRDIMMPAFFGLLLTWIFSRTFSFTIEFIPYSWAIFFQGGPKTKPLFSLWVFQIFCVYSLWLLNQFWLYQLLMIAYRKLRYGSESSPRDKKA